jgi:hypothetical protein
VSGSGQEPGGQLVEQVAGHIRYWGLEQPAILFLEVTKPLSFIASQGLLLCEPLLRFLFTEPRVADYANLLADRSSVEHLIVRLEQDKSVRCDASEEKG